MLENHCLRPAIPTTQLHHHEHTGQNGRPPSHSPLSLRWEVAVGFQLHIKAFLDYLRDDHFLKRRLVWIGGCGYRSLWIFPYNAICHSQLPLIVVCPSNICCNSEKGLQMPTFPRINSMTVNSSMP